MCETDGAKINKEKRFKNGLTTKMQVEFLGGDIVRGLPKRTMTLLDDVP